MSGHIDAAMTKRLADVVHTRGVSLADAVAIVEAVAPTIQAAALRDLARVCFDEGDAGVIVGGIEVVETYVYDTIAALTGDERDQRNADLMREIAGRLMAEKLGRS